MNDLAYIILKKKQIIKLLDMHFCRLDKKRYTRTTKLNTVGCVSDYTFYILLKQISKKIHTLVRIETHISVPVIEL